LENITKVSKERLASEFQLWMLGDYFLMSLKKLLETNFFKVVFKEFQVPLDYRKVYYGNSYPWARLILFLQLQNHRKPIYQQLGLSNEIQNYVEEACYWWSSNLDNQAFEKVFEPGSRLGLEVATGEGVVDKTFAKQLLQAGAKHQWQKPKPLVGFTDLPSDLKKNPPSAGRVLKEVFYLQIRQGFFDKSEALKGLEGFLKNSERK
jgi:tRNA nucleotidyltransferase/poly(A) polymerase